uniref:Cyclic nucleotide-binding domain-containing protein n=1 Tax=Odontella aurita TaxID=265563 RepID=A0A7S4J6E6_9STRA|mmetsp:Transcript_39698/g.119290  ORF Transcript_39698/g.119290 Transcript_39698/m.119290 type:complete len:155 (+) Transcript_39698:1325-1789(+)
MGPYTDILRQNSDQKSLKAVPFENKPELTQSDAEVLASAIVDSDYGENHILYKEGTKLSPALFLVRSGQVSVTNSSGLNKAVTQGGYFGNGTLGGDISLSFIAKRTFVAKEKCKVGVLKGGDISSVLHLARCDTLDLQGITKHKILGEGTFGQV